MHQEQGKSGWVILSCEAESILENLLRRLEAQGIGPERLTLVRIEREPSEHTWTARQTLRQTGKRAENVPPPSSRFKNELLFHSILWGLILAMIGLTVGVGRYSPGSLVILTLLFFLAGSTFALIVTHFRRMEIQRANEPSKPHTSEDVPSHPRVEPIMVGIKIARGEIEKVNEIARELVSQGR